MVTRTENQELTLLQPVVDCLPVPGVLQRDVLTVTRLIVLVPEKGIDNNAMAHRIWTLAAPCQIPVLFLALAGTGGGEDDARLRLATLASMTRDDHLQADIYVSRDNSWVRVIHQLWQPGDAVICPAEQMIGVQGAGQQPLSQVLEYLLDIPVYVLPGLYAVAPIRETASASGLQRLMKIAAFLIVPFMIVAGFFYMQVRIHLQTTGYLQTVLLLVSSLVEVGLIGAWGVLNS